MGGIFFFTKKLCDKKEYRLERWVIEIKKGIYFNLN